MSISVGLHRDFSHRGETTFSAVIAKHLSGHDCKPEGVFSYRHLNVEANGDVIVVRLGKHHILDQLTVNKICDELLGVADRPDCHRLLLDLSGVTHLSNAMLATLLKLRRQIEDHGANLKLCGLHSQLRSAFTITRLDRLFEITDAEGDAIKPVAPQSPLARR
jgi:anti-anti-sigma factor